MVIITGGEAVSGGVEHTGVEGIGDGDGESGTFGCSGWGFEFDGRQVRTGTVDDIGLVSEMLGKLLARASDRFPVRRTGVIPEGKARVHDERVVGDCAVHTNDVRVVLNAWEGTLYVVVSGVTVVSWV